MALEFERVIADHYGPQTAITYDKIAYEKFWSYPEALAAVATEVVWCCSNFVENSSLRILDIGAGTGNLARSVAEEFINRRRAENRTIELEITLYDSSKYMMEEAVSKLNKLNIKSLSSKVGRIEDGAWGSDYDLIVSSFAIHHLKSIEKKICIQRMFNSLRPGAVAVLLDKIWLDHHQPSSRSEEAFLCAAASKFYPLVREKFPSVSLSDVVEAIRVGFVGDGDIPDPLSDHIKWFHEAGFKNVQNLFGSFGIASICGSRGRGA